MGIKDLIGKKMSKPTKFMGEEIKISKLSVAEVLSIQDAAKNIGSDETKGFEILRTVIRASVENAESLSDTDFDAFPMDELSKLSNEIMKFSGLGAEQKEVKQ